MSKPFRLEEHPIDHVESLDVVVVGAGIAGIVAGILLPAKVPGIRLRILERESNLGGVWLTNTYPGVRCDIPADVYQSTFAPSSDWSSNYPPGAEIRAYWEGLAVRYGVTQLISFNTKVRSAQWLRDRCKWKVHVVTTTTNKGQCKDEESVVYANVLITATGTFSEPRWPDIPGMAAYEGHLQHSGHWDQRCKLAGKSVALIGNGAAGLQMLPELQREALEVHHYIRSPTWISPSFGGEDIPTETRQAPEDPEAYVIYRRDMESKTYARFSMLMKDAPRSEEARKAFYALMKRRLGPAADTLLDSLVPSFAPNCRRLTPAPGYLEALASPNVTLVTNAIASFSATGINTLEGVHHKHDVVVCCTGSDASFAPTFSIVNDAGVDLRHLWSTPSGFPDTYLGMAAPDFPNMYFILGPNSTGQPGPLIYIIERQVTYLAKLLNKMTGQGVKAMVPTRTATDDFRAYCDAYFPRTVMMDGCRSWYNGGVAGGRIRALWPGSAWHADIVRRDVRWEDFDYVYRSESGNRFAYFGNGWTSMDVEAAVNPGEIPKFATYLDPRSVSGDRLAITVASTVGLVAGVINTHTTTYVSGVPLFTYETNSLTDRNLPHQHADLFSFNTKGPALSSGECKPGPGDSTWPSLEEWDALDEALGRALIRTVPLAAPCYQNWGVYDTNQCEAILTNWTSPYLHENDPTSVMWPVWEGRSCLPTGKPSNATCTLGAYPVYAVNATNVAQIQLAVNFARNKRLRLVIKNTGHDYQGKSSGAASLSIWTHNLQDLAYTPDYTLGNFSGSIMHVGAGVVTDDLAKAADEHDASVVGGMCASVGFAGGYFAGGGHSPLSSVFGLAADHILAINVVTADGRFITVTEHTHPDLYWALRGGGPSTFGVTTSVVVRLHPKVQVTTSRITFQTSHSVSNETFWKGVKAYFEYFDRLTQAGVYAPVNIRRNSPYYNDSSYSLGTEPMVSTYNSQWIFIIIL
ncbi:hypothetical protein ACLOAV_003264 [Pseudogymnoascus australis]